MLLVRDGELTLGYLDLWRASRGEQLRIRELRAGVLDGDIERLADGRASWQFGNKTETPDTSAQATKIPEFGRLEVDSGSLKFRDALTELNLDSTFSLVDRSAGATTRLPAAAEAAASAAGFHLEASGTYKKADVKAELNTSGILPVIGDTAATVAVPVKLEAHAGGASITFVGTATDAIHLTALKGRFDVEGPSAGRGRRSLAGHAADHRAVPCRGADREGRAGLEGRFQSGRHRLEPAERRVHLRSAAQGAAALGSLERIPAHAGRLGPDRRCAGQQQHAGRTRAGRVGEAAHQLEERPGAAGPRLRSAVSACDERQRSDRHLRPGSEQQLPRAVEAAAHPPRVAGRRAVAA